MPQYIDVKPGRYRESSTGREVQVHSVAREADMPPTVVNYAYLDDPGHVLSTPYAEFAAFGRFAEVS